MRRISKKALQEFTFFLLQQFVCAHNHRNGFSCVCCMPVQTRVHAYAMVTYRMNKCISTITHWIMQR